MLSPSLYPQCNIVAHRRLPELIGDARVINSSVLPPTPLLNQPDDLPHPLPLVRRSTSEGIVSRQVKQDGITTRLRSLSEP
jgi:hypothetical protein